MKEIRCEESQYYFNKIREYWRQQFAVKNWLAEDIYMGFINQFVRRVIITDLSSWQKLQGSPVIYLANHQTGIESFLFIFSVGGLSRTPVAALAKKEHQETWLGKLSLYSDEYPGINPCKQLIFFNRKKPKSFFEATKEITEEINRKKSSILIHVEGTRALSCRHSTSILSRQIVKLALSQNVPVVPVRFVGGLPIAESDTRLEFPVNFGSQDYYLGSPIFPDELKGLNYKKQKKIILNAINELGGSPDKEKPNPPDPELKSEIIQYAEEKGISYKFTTILKILERLEEKAAETEMVLKGIEQGKPVVPGIKSEKERWLHKMVNLLQDTGGN